MLRNGEVVLTYTGALQGEKRMASQVEAPVLTSRLSGAQAQEQREEEREGLLIGFEKGVEEVRREKREGGGGQRKEEEEEEGTEAFKEGMARGLERGREVCQAYRICLRAPFSAKSKTRNCIPAHDKSREQLYTVCMVPTQRRVPEIGKAIPPGTDLAYTPKSNTRKDISGTT
eukprot:1425650-Rhodomonas_salina.2